MEVPVAARELPRFFDDFFRTLDRLENRAHVLKAAFGTEGLEKAQRSFSSSVTDYGLHIIMLDSIQKPLKGLPPDTGWKREWSDNLVELVLAGQKLAQYLYLIRGDPTQENLDQALERISAIRTATLYVLFGAELDWNGDGGYEPPERPPRPEPPPPPDAPERERRSYDYPDWEQDWSDAVGPQRDEWDRREPEWSDYGEWDRYDRWGWHEDGREEYERWDDWYRDWEEPYQDWVYGPEEIRDEPEYRDDWRDHKDWLEEQEPWREYAEPERERWEQDFREEPEDWRDTFDTIDRWEDPAYLEEREREMRDYSDYYRDWPELEEREDYREWAESDDGFYFFEKGFLMEYARLVYDWGVIDILIEPPGYGWASDTRIIEGADEWFGVHKRMEDAMYEAKERTGDPDEIVQAGLRVWREYGALMYYRSAKWAYDWIDHYQEIKDIDIRFWLFSPGDLHIYDQFGRHVGINYETGEFESQIPGIVIELVDNHQVITSTQPIENYTIVVVGTETGAYDLRIIENVSGETVYKRIINVPITQGENHIYTAENFLPDTAPPISSIEPIYPCWQSAESVPFTIRALARDPDNYDGEFPAGVKEVKLYYRYSPDNQNWGEWQFYGTDNRFLSSWNFDAPEGDGFYEFYTLATDGKGNIESTPNEADARVAVDISPPTSSASVSTHHVNAEAVPLEITATTSDQTSRENVPSSSVKQVELFYRYSPDNSKWSRWISYEVDNDPPWEWSFNLLHGDGYYVFSTIAVDEAGNVELESVDGFTGEELDPSVWSVGRVGVSEGEVYLSNGQLHLKARAASSGSYGYISVVSNSSFDFSQGYIFRVKMAVPTLTSPEDYRSEFYLAPRPPIRSLPPWPPEIPSPETLSSWLRVSACVGRRGVQWMVQRRRDGGGVSTLFTSTYKLDPHQLTGTWWVAINEEKVAVWLGDKLVEPPREHGLDFTEAHVYLTHRTKVAPIHDVTFDYLKVQRFDVDASAWADTISPISSIEPITPYWQNAELLPVEVVASASDLTPASGATPSEVKRVDLYYIFSEDGATWGSWQNFGASERESAPGVADHMVISEIQIDSIDGTGGTKDDWIELYNPTPQDINLVAEGYRIERAAPSGGDPSIFMRFGDLSDGTYPSGTVILAYGYYLIVRDGANDELKAMADAIGTRSSFTLTDSNVIYLGKGPISGPDDDDIVDFVGYGDVPDYEGGGPVPQPPDGGSIERKSSVEGVTKSQGNGYDSNNNAEDFVIRTPPEPQNFYSPFEMPPGGDRLEWSFDALEGDGYYKFSSVAMDEMGNVEQLPEEADAGAGIDTVPPASSVNPITLYWQNAETVPFTVLTTASDTASGVENITLWYRYSPDNVMWGSWTESGPSLGLWAGIADHVVISEVYVNPYAYYDRAEFVELYNPTTQPIDLYGYYLYDPTGKEPFHHLFEDVHFIIQPHGYCLIADYAYPQYRESESAATGVQFPDADVLTGLTMNNSAGLMALFAPNRNLVDSVAWGNWPHHYSREGPSTPMPGEGQSIKRYSTWRRDPLEDMGNGYDTQNNLNDFMVRGRPNPRNSKSPPKPAPFDPPEGDGYYQFCSIGTDRAGNIETLPDEADVQVGIDTTPPVSEVNPIELYWRNDPPVEIAATASDPTLVSGVVPSGLSQVELWYRSSADNVMWSEWQEFEADDQEPWAWRFTGTDAHYEFYSIAVDEAGNAEQPEAAVAPHLVISEVYPNPVVAYDRTEFVELYNPISSDISLEGYSLWEETKRITFAPDDVIPACGFYLIGKTTYPDYKDLENADWPEPDAVAGWSLSNSGDAIILVAPDGSIVDMFGYGTTGNYEGSPFPSAPTQGSSAERYSSLARDPSENRGNAFDTDRNSYDFFEQPTPNPQNSLSPSEEVPRKADARVGIDTTTPRTEIAYGQPYYVDADGTLYVSAGTEFPIPATEFTLSAVDNLSGVALTEYQIDETIFTYSGVFAIPSEGSHDIQYWSTDMVGNIEDAKSLHLIVDTPAVITRWTIGEVQKLLWDPSLNRRASEKLSDALERLSKALSDMPVRWFEDLKHAVQRLQDAERHGADTASIVEVLVFTARYRAKTAIVDAEAMVGSANRHVQRAWDHYDRGVRFINNNDGSQERYSDALEQFKHAYVEAMQGRVEWVLIAMSSVFGNR